jgi:hypothetical protein
MGRCPWLKTSKSKGLAMDRSVTYRMYRANVTTGPVTKRTYQWNPWGVGRHETGESDRGTGLCSWLKARKSTRVGDGPVRHLTKQSGERPGRAGYQTGLSVESESRRPSRNGGIGSWNGLLLLANGPQEHAG